MAAGGIELVACSEGGTGFPTQHDVSSQTDTGTGLGDGGDNDAGAPQSADAARDATAADCGAPLTLQPSPDAGAFCPFMAGGTKRNCSLGEHCCVYAASAKIDSTCSPQSEACQAPVSSGGADFECDEPSDCTDPTKPTCCLDGIAVTTATCPRNGFVSGIKRTYCSADPSCKIAGSDAGAIVCGANSECGTGTCAPLSTKTKTIGACIP